MAELPTMPIRTDALLGDTTDMTAAEFGAYVRILLAMWRNGGWLPNDERRLARYGTLSSGQWARSGPRIMECLTDMGNGRLTQGKLHEEYQRALGVSAQATENATNGWKKRRLAVAVEQKGGVAVEPQAGSPDNKNLSKTLKPLVRPDAPASVPQCYPDPVSKEEEIPPLSPQGGGGAVPAIVEPKADLEAEFEKVWAYYPRKVGIGAAERAWRKARKTASFEEIAKPLGQWIRAIKGTPIDKTPHFSTWLNERRWRDDQSHAANRPRTSREDLDEVATIKVRDGPALSSRDDLARLFPADPAETPALKVIR